MAEVESAPAEGGKKGGKKPLLVGLVLALALGGGGFYAAYSGLLPAGGEHEPAGPALSPAPDVAFVAITPLVISLGPESGARHLRFTGALEVPSNLAPEVEKLMPRVVDVLNGYLRAVDNRQFEEPASLIRLRAQMLRRVQIVVGEGRVRDLLVTEFLLN